MVVLHIWYVRIQREGQAVVMLKLLSVRAKRKGRLVSKAMRAMAWKLRYILLICRNLLAVGENVLISFRGKVFWRGEFRRRGVLWM